MAETDLSKRAINAYFKHNPPYSHTKMAYMFGQCITLTKKPARTGSASKPQELLTIREASLEIY
jgi:hypothetical protein